MRLCIILVLLSLITACATKNLSKDYTLEQTNDTGIVVASIVKSGHGHWAPTYYVKTVDGEYFGRFDFKVNGFDRIISDYDGLKGRLVVQEFPAGEYTISGWYIYQTIAELRSLEGFDIRFTVEPGKVNYIGELNMRMEAGGLFKMGVGGIDVTVKDSQLRDLTKLKLEYPKLSDETIQSQLMKIISLGEEED